MVSIAIIPLSEFDRIREANIETSTRLQLVADMCRANALASVKRAGSGHLGSSFSSLDIVTALYYSELNVKDLGIDHPSRDIYFSSKGHDVPGHYSVLYSLGILEEDQLLRLRRLGGTCGHPDVSTAGIEANSGSLGMGISKAKGFALGKKLLGHAGRVFVMLGDGEMHEGQIFEGLQTSHHQQITNLHVIIDHNKVQSDKLVAEICTLGELEAKLQSFGWHVSRCDGHDFNQLHECFEQFAQIHDRPKVLIADTIKGRGVSFMEHPVALKAGGGLYRWHAGAPDDESFTAGHAEIVSRVDSQLTQLGLEPLTLREVPPEDKGPSGVSREFVAEAYGNALADIVGERKDVVVLDADLAADCRIRIVEDNYPERFVENGIAEQDMVSTAGGLALQGLLPIVNSFAAFLSSRANEQIYNNACENTKIVYVNHYSGLIPAGPGQSHQSLRDISLMAALPNITILQPCNAVETRQALNYCVNEAQRSCVLRLIIGPSPRIVELPPDYTLQPGIGVSVNKGIDAVLFTYGPVMLHEALSAAHSLEKEGVGLEVVNMPWLNLADTNWLLETVAPFRSIYVLEDHSVVGGLGAHLMNCLVTSNAMDGRRMHIFGLDSLPAWGTPTEVLRHHGLDGESIAKRILNDLREKR